jgi:hypothetical protein
MFKIKLETNFTPLALYQDLPPGIEKKKLTREERGGGVAELATVVFNFSSGVAAGVLASWIWEKVKGKPNITIRINNKRIVVDKSGIKEKIQQEVEIQRR